MATDVISSSPEDLILPPVIVSPAEEARPPPATESPEEVNEEVAVPVNSILPLLRIDPPVTIIPEEVAVRPETASPFQIEEVALATNLPTL